jgi:hypothetical protein
MTKTEFVISPKIRKLYFTPHSLINGIDALKLCLFNHSSFLINMASCCTFVYKYLAFEMNKSAVCVAMAAAMAAAVAAAVAAAIAVAIAAAVTALQLLLW